MSVKPSVLDAESRRWRFGLLVACAVLAVGVFFVNIEGSPIMPWCSTTLGLDPIYNQRAAGVFISSVENGGPADLAGLRAGDRIDFGNISFRERWRMRDVIRVGWGGLVGEHLRYAAHRGSRVVVAVVSPKRVKPSWPTWAAWLEIVASFWGLLFAGVLAVRRPDLVVAGLLSLVLLSVFGLNPLTGLAAPWPIVEFVIHTLSGALWISVPILCLTILASRVARPLSTTRKVLALIAIAAAVALAAEGIVFYVGWFLLSLPVFWAWGEPYITDIGLLVSFACAVAAFLASRGEERARLFWITASVSAIWLFFGPLSTIVALVDPVGYSEYAPYLNVPLAAAMVSLPIALTYAVLSRRIVDLGYVLNQAAIFSGVSVIVVGLFMLSEWVLGGWFGRVSHLTNLEISIALVLGLGFSVRAIHSRVERVLDRLFFRKRHNDEMAIRSFAEEASDATDADTLVRETKKTLETFADAAFVTVVMDDGSGRYGDVSESDPAIVALRDRHKAIDLKTLPTQLQGEFAYPMIARGKLVGALVLGAKRSGESYAPDESNAIMQLAHEVGHALRFLTLEGVLREHHWQADSEPFPASP